MQSTESPTPAIMYGTAWKEERTAELTLLALQSGLRAIDTANQRRHYFEAGVGEALAEAYRAGLVTRAQISLQTKFTYRGGQDHRLPYDPDASPADQVSQSLSSSLEHLGTDYLDSFILHGPSSAFGWTPTDQVVWSAMLREREAGHVRSVGVSNVALHHLQQLEASGQPRPQWVQNRCFARMGWDREVRAYCRDRGITYQGFSLLTANVEILRHPVVIRAAQRLEATVPQVIFAFARAVGMLPLTGTTDAQHMQQDLESLRLELTDGEVSAVESLAG